MSIRVAIADDHTLVAEGISKILSRHSDNITITAHYSTGAALLEGLKEGEQVVTGQSTTDSALRWLQW